MPSSDEVQGRPDEPGSFVVGKDGVRRPNLDDPAMLERARLKNEASAEAATQVGKEDSHVS